jgi:hypothetical protein
MSEQRVVTDLQTGREISLSEAMSKDPDEYKRLRAERKARFSRVLERGMIADRLQVDLPATLWGEWVPNDKQSIYEKQLLGFVVDREYATKRALHDQGDNMSIVGDCVFMIQDVEDHNLLEEIRRENFEAANGKPGQTARLQGEEKEFMAQSRTIGMPTIEESASKAARKADLESAVRSINLQNQEAAAKTASRVIK